MCLRWLRSFAIRLQLLSIKDGKLVTSGNMEEVVKNQSLEDIFMEVTTDDK